MRSFIVKLKDFFRLDTSKQPDSNFNSNIRHLLIPLYQREYKWTNEKISALINDIIRRDKFLGNVILDETPDCYEIVDGQQRITTCYLILLCLYNLYAGYPHEQESLLHLIKPYDNHYILKNNSLGNYISEIDDTLKIHILDEDDVYYQRGDFERAYKQIYDILSLLEDQTAIREFKRKLLDCQLLVLINDQHTNTSPIEQIFLDINEKAQLLEVEDIFKGHCFENYEEEFHNVLRDTWTSLKKCGMEFTKLGFDDLSQYIYLFLLEKDNSNIPETLSSGGKHYLEGKTMDETERLLLDMISYGESVLNFHQKLLNNDYRFSDLSPNSFEYRNTSDHQMLKTMSLNMLNYSNAQYQKLPLMFFIYALTTNVELRDAITHIDFRKIITNLYIYASLFIFSGGRKSKQVIDHTIRDALMESHINISNVVLASKELRKTKIEEFIFTTNAKFESLSFIYSIMDNYISNDNWLPMKYSREVDFNLEHFIIPDNRNSKITWLDGGNSVELVLPRELVVKNKKNTINYLVLDKTLNGLLEHYDIETKIDKIKEWYELHRTSIPEHINLFIQNIESMSEYNALKTLKGSERDCNTIKTIYNNFLEAYFRVENQQRLLSILQERFKSVFQN